QPEGPIIAKNSPVFTCKLILFRAVVSTSSVRKTFESFSVFIIAMYYIMYVSMSFLFIVHGRQSTVGYRLLGFYVIHFGNRCFGLLIQHPPSDIPHLTSDIRHPTSSSS